MMKFTTWLWRWVAVPFFLISSLSGWTSSASYTPTETKQNEPIRQYFHAGDLDAVGAGDPTETLAFLAAIQKNATVNTGNALACTAAACASQAAVNLESDCARGPRPVSHSKKICDVM